MAYNAAAATLPLGLYAPPQHAHTTNPSTEFTVHVSNLFVPDFGIFQCWLRGLSVDHAMLEQAKCQKNPAMFLRKYILSQYRHFEMMEHYLHRPTFFQDQFLFPLPSAVKMKMIELYYRFDEAVMRELLGKKLTYRMRKDLDDVCQKTQISLGSCRRQFDNLKRITKHVDEVQQETVPERIQSDFLLPRRLACQYAHILFINTNRLDTSKKKLLQYTFTDFEYCASVFMRYWASPTRDEFDPQLAQDIRDIRQLLNTNKDAFDEFRFRVAQYLMESAPSNSAILAAAGPSNHPALAFFNSLMDNNNNNSNQNVVGSAPGTATASTQSISNHATPAGNATPSATLQSVGSASLGKDFPSQFKTLVRHIMTLGCGLTHPKECRDIFIAIIEKIMEPCVSYGWRATDAETFLIALRECWPRLTTLSPSFVQKMHVSWYRLTMGLQLAALCFFNDISVALQL